MGCCDGSVLTSPNFQQLQDLLGRQPIEHNWQRDGWAPFDPVVMTADGAQNYTPSVANGRGIITGNVAGSGSLRVAYLHEATNWADQEMVSVNWGPTADWNGTNAQQGHLHRVRNIGGNVWEGIAIWTSIVFGGDYSFLHVAGVRFDGTTLDMSNATPGVFGANDLSFITRAARILGHERYNFLGWINQYTLMHPEWLQYLTVGDLVSIVNLGDVTFNEASAAITTTVGTATGFVTVTEPTTTSASPYVATGGGELAPIGVDLQKRYTPQVMATRVMGGTAASCVVEGKRWRLGEDEPDWGDPRVQRATLTPSGPVPTIATGPGKMGYWAAHFHTGSGGAWGDTRFRCLAANNCVT